MRNGERSMEHGAWGMETEELGHQWVRKTMGHRGNVNIVQTSTMLSSSWNHHRHNHNHRRRHCFA